MKHVAAYMLCVLGGKANPTEKDIRAVFSVVDATVDDDKLKALLAEVGGKDINEIIAEGSTKLASVPSGGGGGGAVSSSSAGGGGAAEEKKAEPEEEEEEGDMGFSLFD
mmetsp:Transcript_73642/g.172975  ORF Transcript_73642/g.172975 Transcript_73642/m.172975 type:complete len:109 (-) Transcript_73642:65-391(-)|eukprot:CAMPEP_0117029706 /NCGR_PEP_ID=MMETSP0472-20121206/21488_1 /TAXON_ID=693140 ORGANISM="Tiarina fusus, Strain LIS" /NCGR_SAMPLE_ID=MMETSP0472 /ASSEMBLY_ACC=CAM_ASM_000603 /LENGTH=108 /DNA_ID=CAMNT_0004737547 /DNA_START=32 /DNA_END=358 /DNA_ORIENTATION=-